MSWTERRESGVTPGLGPGLGSRLISPRWQERFVLFSEHLGKRRFERSVLFLALAAPLFYGLVDARPIFIWLVCFCICIIAGRHKGLKRKHLLQLLPVLLPIAVYLLVALFQLLPASYGQAAAGWESLQRLLGVSDLSPLTPDPAKTMAALGPALLYIACFSCGMLMAIRRGALGYAIKVLAIYFPLYAVFVIAWNSVYPNYVMFEMKQTHLDSLTGTFFNRNTAAAFLSVGVFVWIGKCADCVREQHRRRRLWWQEFRSLRPVLWRLAILALILTALFLTRSRAGIYLTFIVANLVIGIKVIAWRKRIRSDQASVWMRSALAGLTSVFVLLLLFFEFGSLGLESRLRSSGLEDRGRSVVYQGSFLLVGQRPWIGNGIGAFEANFPAVRSVYGGTIGIWDRAHSSILELAVDAGVPFAVLTALCWVYVCYRLLTKALASEGDAALLTTGAVVLQAGIHSLIDYPLQIPGFAILVCILTGGALVRSGRVAIGRSSR